MPPEPPAVLPAAPQAIEKLPVVLPDRPPLPSMLPSFVELLVLLKSECTRLGDNSAYGNHGTTGVYCEGRRWAVDCIRRGLLAEDDGAERACPQSS